MGIPIHGEHMLSITRRNQIKDIILEKKSITVSELSTKFSVTEETIRRDLKVLEEDHFLTRTYGGAFIQEGVQNNVDLKLRANTYTSSKKQIASMCVPLIHNGDSIFLDESTTSLHIAHALKLMRLTIVTNSLMIVNDLKDYDNINLVLIGGFYSKKSESFTGQLTLDALDKYYLDKSFISCRTLSLNNGISDSTEFIASLRKKIISRSNKTYIVADYSKFDKTSFIHICNFNEIDGIITDKPLSQGWREMAKEKNITLLDGPSTD